MILSDQEIMAAISRGSINIDPRPEFGSPLWSSTAVDLTLDRELRIWTDLVDEGLSVHFEPGSNKFNTTSMVDRFSELKYIDRNEGYILKPGGFILGWTVEKIKLPYTSKLAARVEGKSSLARLGVGVHVTAPTIHAGFGDRAGDATYAGTPIRLEIWHAGKVPVKLVKGLKICQLIIEEVHGTPQKGYEGSFAFQGPSST